MIPSSLPPVVPDIDPRAILDYAFARTTMLVAPARLHIFTFLLSQPLFKGSSLTESNEWSSDTTILDWMTCCSLFRFYSLHAQIICEAMDFDPVEQEVSHEYEHTDHL